MFAYPKTICPTCRIANKGAGCNVPGHTNYSVHHSYRVPPKTKDKAWKQIAAALENDERLPLTEPVRVGRMRSSFGSWRYYDRRFRPKARRLEE